MAERQLRSRVAGAPVIKERRKKPAEVFSGDTVEYGMSCSMRVSGSEIWLKASASTTVRDDESGEDAWERVTQFVDSKIDQLTMSVAERLR